MSDAVYDLSLERIALIRRMVVAWGGTAPGAPTIHPAAPYGSLDRDGDIANVTGDDEGAEEEHRALEDGLAVFVQNAHLKPGRYQYHNGLAKLDPSAVGDVFRDAATGETPDVITFAVTPEHLALIPRLHIGWNAEQGVPRVDPERPYGADGAYTDAMKRHLAGLNKPVIMGQSMGGNVCLTLALRYEHEFLALIALEACDYSPGWWIEPLHHPHIHGGEVVATSVFGLMSPESPDDYRWETWWYYAQGGPGVFKGDLYFYSVDSDYRDQVSKISGKLPIFFLTGEYDFACTPEMTERTAERVKNSECIIFSGGHFPTSEDPVKFKEVIAPVLRKILALDPERRRETGAFTARSSLSIARSERPAANASGRRVIEL